MSSLDSIILSNSFSRDEQPRMHFYLASLMKSYFTRRSETANIPQASLVQHILPLFYDVLRMSPEIDYGLIALFHQAHELYKEDPVHNESDMIWVMFMMLASGNHGAMNTFIRTFNQSASPDELSHVTSAVEHNQNEGDYVGQPAPISLVHCMSEINDGLGTQWPEKSVEMLKHFHLASPWIEAAKSIYTTNPDFALYIFAQAARTCFVKRFYIQGKVRPLAIVLAEQETATEVIERIANVASKYKWLKVREMAARQYARLHIEEFRARTWRQFTKDNQVRLLNGLKRLGGSALKNLAKTGVGYLQIHYLVLVLLKNVFDISSIETLRWWAFNLPDIPFNANHPAIYLYAFSKRLLELESIQGTMIHQRLVKLGLDWVANPTPGGVVDVFSQLLFGMQIQKNVMTMMWESWFDDKDRLIEQVYADRSRFSEGSHHAWIVVLFTVFMLYVSYKLGDLEGWITSETCIKCKRRAQLPENAPDDADSDDDEKEGQGMPLYSGTGARTWSEEEIAVIDARQSRAQQMAVRAQVERIRMSNESEREYQIYENRNRLKQDGF